MGKFYCPIILKDLDNNITDQAYPWQASSACQDWNTLDKKTAEGLVIDNSWSDLINTAGQPIYYYVYGFDKSKANNFLGEDSLADYKEPFEIKAYLEIKDVPKSLSALGGFFAEDTITAYVHIKTFNELTKDLSYFDELKLRREPKPQDLIQLIQYGCDRPGDRGANYYEITNKEDQLISGNLNPIFQHFVWKITAKRFMFSHEPGSVEPYGEEGNCQVYDNVEEGKVEKPKDENWFPDKAYDYSVDKESKKTIFNQSRNNQDSIYGGYYQE